MPMPRLTPLLVTALAAALLAACAPESPKATAAAGARAVPGIVDVGQAVTVRRLPSDSLHARPSAVSTGEAIAAYPNRGDLVGYDQVRRPERRAGHTFHPVRVSEEHALEAIGTGTLFLTGPDGRRMELQYERHVEHPGGDWSWIGRDENGVDGILTFGEQAVFGVVPYGSGDSLRLTTNAGQTWMATSDRDVLSPLQQRIRGGLESPDYRIPAPLDEDGISVSALVSAAATSAPSGRAEGAPNRAGSGGTTVDVLLGYTPGFATMLGGASQAQTRLNHIVTVGNQTFVNSGVAVSLRLVGTLQVNYTDAGSNQTALEQLTGSSGQADLPVPASLQPLRNARETHGADLVSLVRRFRDADHQGCGIAWLVGGNQTDITPGYEKFGYSVVSDSNGLQSPDNGHYCIDETLVHELGHNMGSQHDREAATDENGLRYGRYAYSFGYKTGAASGNFYTVMAYGDAGQTAYRIFSNPQSTYCGGRACGTPNEDNARSLRATAPLIAAFRESVGGGRIRTDFNGDGFSDLLWRNGGDGRNAIWRSGNSATQQSILPVATAWQVVGEGDFDGDGRADIVWRHATAGRNAIWRGGNGNSTIDVTTVAKASWRVVGVGDFNGDGRSDLLWRDSSDGRNAIWLSGNSATQLGVIRLANLAWRVAGVGDIDGDGRDDIIWRDASNGRNVAWRGGDGNSTIAMSTVADTRWQVAAVDDFNGDGRDDVFWRHSASGRNSLWLSGNSATQQAIPDISMVWRVEGSGDFNGDGSADLVWRKNDGSNAIWRSANANSTMPVTRVAGTAWDIVP